MAVEKDCDQRVVRAVGDPTAYGRLLLEAKRLSLELDLPLVTAASSFLGRRVRRLAEGTSRPFGSAPRLALSGGSAHAALDRAALEVASAIRYAPARREGEPLAVWIAQPLRFPVE